METTIYALSTAPGRAGVAIIRISGPKSGDALDVMTAGRRPKARLASVRRLQNTDGEIFDEALVLWFPGPGSFTGEDCAELHVHGGLAVIETAFAALDTLGLVPAEAGEFTRRAFENDRIDLTEAEGLADLIEAETEGQRRQALAQMTGSLRGLYEEWREALISVLASVEGEIDFPDEGDVPDALSHRAFEPLVILIASMQEHLDDGRRGERIRTGFTIALIGAPNAGKSSLLNKLAGRDAAIVIDAGHYRGPGHDGRLSRDHLRYGGSA